MNWLRKKWKWVFAALIPVVLAMPLFVVRAAPPIKVMVQWAEETPQDWVEVDSSQWENLAKKSKPVRGEAVDNTDGWINAISVLGITFSSHFENFAIEELSDGGVKLLAWHSGVEHAGDLHAIVWTILPLAPDENLGGAMNTRQSRVVYAEGDTYTGFESLLPLDKTELRNWSLFREPAEEMIRYGFDVGQTSFDKHESMRSTVGWRDFSRLPAEELDENGRVKIQRDLGRWNKAEGTITYIARSAARANGIHAVPQENALELTTTSVSSESVNPAGVNFDIFIFSTPSNEPNSDDWPSGNYRYQIDVTAAGGGQTYGLLDFGSVNGHFARVNSGLTSDLETFQQAESAFSGTGLKLATTGTVDPSSGSAGDRWELLLSGNDPCEDEATFTLQLNESDDFADGPWTVAAAVTGQSEYWFDG